MSFLAKFEEACAAFIERAFAATFPSQIEPAQIARKLVATMQANAAIENGRRVAPNVYDVRISSADYERLTSFIDYLQREWEALLHEMAEQIDIIFPYPLHVRLGAGEGVVVGAVEITTSTVGKKRRKSASLSLRVTHGVSAASSYALSGTISIGRDEQSDIVLSDPHVSRKHARIVVRGARAVIEDTESSNGTFVNGARIAAATTLAAGDVVVVGESELVVESDARPA